MEPALKAWHFSTEALPVEQRRAAWEDALNRLCLPVGDGQVGDDFSASVACIVSPLGIEFARIHAGPHTISGVYPNQPSSIWMVLLLAGGAEFFDGRGQHTIAPGDMAYGPSGVPATLEFKTECRQLFIKVPQIALSQRLIRPLSIQVGYLPGRAGISHVLSSLLSALADSLEDITGQQLRPIELSLTEFLITCLIDPDSHASAPLPGNTMTSIKTAQLHQICQKIETLLGHSDLTPQRVADEQGVSLRYLQKLFANSGSTFSGYVRNRRLERCRADLVSPLYADLTITEICYRWGFNASSHFSRAFRKQFGQSPRTYRRERGQLTSHDGLGTVYR